MSRLDQASELRAAHSDIDLAARLKAVADATELELDRLLTPDGATPQRLLDAMRYATLEAGKRLRPFLVHATGELAGADPAACRRAGAAVELVHCYSLAHDDLPAMDDAELRRGKPACHRAFDEATAILAGDALVALAFDVLARTDWPCAPDVRTRLILGLARASGAAGMCGGQMLDLASTHQALSEAELVQLQNLKTGAIIRWALEAGCILGDLPEAAGTAIGCYADALGLAFQIRDDLLDLPEAGASTGKDAGRDQLLGRTTFVTHLGVVGAESRLLELRDRGLTAVERAGLPTELLAALFDFVITRRN